MINIVHNQAQLGSITFHYLVFKNIEVANLNELNDNIAGLLYEQQIALTQQFVSGNLNDAKQFNKVEKQTFGERDWPLTWLDNKLNNEKISGYFIGISGGTIKAISSDGFINKIIDTQAFRYCIAGEVIPKKGIKEAEKQIESLLSHLNSAVLFASCSSDDAIATNLYYSEDKVISENSLNNFPNKPNLTLQSANHLNANYLLTCELYKPSDESSYIEKFNEGVLIKTNNESILKIHGFNPIEKGNNEDQIKDSLENITAIIEKHDFTWQQLKLGSAFVKDNADAKILKSLFKEMKIPFSPILIIPVDFPDTKQGFKFNAQFSK